MNLPERIHVTDPPHILCVVRSLKPLRAGERGVAWIITRWRGARRGRCLPYSGDRFSFEGVGGVARSLSILTCSACRGKSCERS